MAYRALEQPRIGWVEADRMGLQMAASLLDTGHDVADRDVVFTMVSGSGDLFQITTGADGLEAL